MTDRIITTDQAYEMAAGLDLQNKQQGRMKSREASALRCLANHRDELENQKDKLKTDIRKLTSIGGDEYNGSDVDVLTHKVEEMSNKLDAFLAKDIEDLKWHKEGLGVWKAGIWRIEDLANNVPTFRVSRDGEMFGDYGGLETMTYEQSLKSAMHAAEVEHEREELVEAKNSHKPSSEAKKDDRAIDRFAYRMKRKMEQSRRKGRDGWEKPSLCSAEFLADMIVGHMEKTNAGNFEDIANLCMMLSEKGADPEILANAFSRRLGTS